MLVLDYIVRIVFLILIPILLYFVVKEIKNTINEERVFLKEDWEELKREWQEEKDYLKDKFSKIIHFFKI